MTTEFTACDFSGLGLTDREIQTVLSGTDPREQIRLLRNHRGPLLEEVHFAQQKLDRLDYLIYQIRNGNQAHV